jgi:hypothetical protein
MQRSTLGSLTTSSRRCGLGVRWGPALLLRQQVRRRSSRSTIRLSLVPTPTVEWARTRVFTETQVNGNLTEFGFFSASSGGTMFARQLFKDSMGNPVVITKTALDQLRITHEIRLWEMDADETYTVTIGGVVYDTTERIGGSQTTMWRPHDGFNTFGTPSCQLTTLQTLSARTSYQAGTGPTTTTKQAYTNGNFYRDVIHTWDPPTANFTTAPAGVGYCRHGVDSTAYQFQNNFTPKIPKDNTKRLTLNIRYTMARP